MDSLNQIKYEVELETNFGRLDKRLRELSQHGLTLWTGVFKKILVDLTASRKARDAAIYGELMQLESLAKEIEPCEKSLKLLEKIYKLKGVVNTICLLLLCLNSVFLYNITRVRTRDFSARVVRVSKRRGDEVYG